MLHHFMNKLNMHSKFMRYLAENMSGGVADANKIEFQEIKFKF